MTDNEVIIETYKREVKDLKRRMSLLKKELTDEKELTVSIINDAEVYRKMRTVTLSAFGDIGQECNVHIGLKDEYQVGDRTLEVLGAIKKIADDFYDIIFEVDEKKINKLYEKK